MPEYLREGGGELEDVMIMGEFNSWQPEVMQKEGEVFV
eukprot:CAMPEP_0170559260 /NCGR_PEP_ID=MMETSP0211-20121228/41446_1 /TAXON_ID=311385 /ORGANISM="Pseudokeronopsis sp., Strain OXSARD2" /LENGTH=37 /DNA_ID= /DNA_START= /DNA_END= /DNA_ORIENTATION=